MGSKKDSYAHKAGRQLAFSLPFFTSLAITQGIVPLLFLQLIYGPAFYSSSILMAVPWILILVFLLIGYYAQYVYKFKGEKFGKFAPIFLILSSFLFLCIAFIFVNNMTLMLNPSEWLELAKKGTSGINLNLNEPQLIPRFLHFAISSIAITGIALGGFGLYYQKKDKNYAHWLYKVGSGIYASVTILQLGFGTWFMLSLPTDRALFFIKGGGLATASFHSSMLFMIISLVFSVLVLIKPSKLKFMGAMISSLVTVLLMIVMRHFLRVWSLEGALDPGIVPVQIQWDWLVIFGTLTVGVIFYIGWLIKICLKANK
ncbi:MAG: hypothetical protein MK033_00385 [Candidatus Caenarcaniphilales bacterium]|nr:hypothetical protein [Candidatus Caenarcaniphilales bacterium]